MFVGIRTGRLELDELWAYVGKKQKRAKLHELEKGDQCTFGLAPVHAADQRVQQEAANHAAAVSLYVAHTHYNVCRSHESLRTSPAVAPGITDRVWTIGDLLEAALATQPIDPVVTAPDRRRMFRVVEGGRNEKLANGVNVTWIQH
jgi:hypothetical protein